MVQAVLTMSGESDELAVMTEQARALRQEMALVRQPNLPKTDMVPLMEGMVQGQHKIMGTVHLTIYWEVVQAEHRLKDRVQAEEQSL
jgi:hypothetical protein